MNNLLELLHHYPVFWAFVWGIVATLIDPCPLALNLTAIGYISSSLRRRRQVWWRSLTYTLGRMTTFATLGLLVFWGSSRTVISDFLEAYAEKFLAFLLILIGVLMLDFFHFHLPFAHRAEHFLRDGRAGGRSYLRIFLLGALFALAFCPHTLLYAGMLLPIAPEGSALASYLLIPMVFALGGGIPILMFSGILTYSLTGMSRFSHGVMRVERITRRITAVLFILVGLYFFVEQFLWQTH